jgi:hypothetical protein
MLLDSAELSYTIHHPSGELTLINHSQQGTHLQAQKRNGQVVSIDLETETMIDMALNVLMFHAQAGSNLSTLQDQIAALVHDYYQCLA